MDLKSVSATIPVVPHHLYLFESLLRNLEEMQPTFDEVIFVLSGLRRSQARKALNLLDNSKVAWRAIHVPFLPLGVNRNIGWLESQGEIVCFLDADDFYSKSYRSVIQERFNALLPDVLLHSHIPFSRKGKIGETQDIFRSSPHPHFSFLDTGELLRVNELGSNRNRLRELRVEARESNLKMPGNWTYPVTQGHASVRRTLVSQVNFINETGMRNEDGIFAKDCLETGARLIVTNDALTAYSLHTSAVPWTLDRFKRIALRILRR